MTTAISTQLKQFESGFELYRPRITDVLEAMDIRPAAFMQTVLVSVERNPKLLECNRQSLFNAAISAAFLGVMIDGATGQGWIIPFKDRAQLVVGYKGYNTMAARGSYSIRGGVIREGDDWECDEAAGILRIRRKLGKEFQRPIIGAWAKAVSRTLPPVIKLLSLDEINEVRKRAPAARKSDSPWNDPTIGFAAMAEKTAKRGLTRAMPLNVGLTQFHTAAVMDEATEERGLTSHIDPDKGLIIDGAIVDQGQTPKLPNAAPVEFTVRWGTKAATFHYPLEVVDAINRGLASCSKLSSVDRFQADNIELVDALALAGASDEAARVNWAFEERRKDLMAQQASEE